MKDSSRLILGLLVFCFLVSVPLDSVFAAPKVDPKTEEQGGVELKSEQYELEQYQATTHFEESWNPFSLDELDKMMNGIANMFFGMTKLVANIVDAGLRELYGLEIVNQFADDIGSASEELWGVLYDNFGVALFVIAVLQLFFFYVAQRNGMKAGQSSLKLICVLVVAGVWFSQSSYFLKTMNSISNEAQGAVMSAGAFLTTEDIDQSNGMEASQALLRNAYFDLAVYNPYLAMNYGTTNEDTITADDSNRITNLVATPLTEKGYSEREEIAEREVDKLGNTSMSISTIYGKIAVSAFSFFFALVLGFPLLLVAFVSFLLQVLMLLIALILPVSFLISILPSFANSGWYTFGRLIAVGAMKIFVGIILLITFMIVNITEGMLPATSTEMYMLNAIITSVLLILMIKYRNKMIEFITAGKVASVDMNTASRVYDKTVKEPSEKIRHGVYQGAQVAAAYAGIRGAGAAFAGEQLEDRDEQRTPQTSDGQQGSDQRTKDVVDLSGYREARSQRTTQPQQEKQKPTSESSEHVKEPKESHPSNASSTNSSLPMGVYNRQELEKTRNPQQKKRKNQESADTKNQRKRMSRTPQHQRLSHQERQEIRERYHIEKNKPITQWEARQQIEDRKMGRFSRPMDHSSQGTESTSRDHSKHRTTSIYSTEEIARSKERQQAASTRENVRSQDRSNTDRDRSTHPSTEKEHTRPSKTTKQSDTMRTPSVSKHRHREVKVNRTSQVKPEQARRHSSKRESKTMERDSVRIHRSHSN
ncbi:CD3337/EF1877 family mobilome membrane protein [Halobacillus sp. Marseille-Q1614]|uniref:CD3337/EF1877 family mobilome membrane protein n=1 Tax=Halobacillus sp. Marseille-Q1614 TaxID=2709134 RepID=UPI00156F08E8|nr:hypothetical protein [Halobacillus sp. Marseille-Q1614]